MNWDEMAVVGHIARAHGIRGQVIVNLETDFPQERFQPGMQLFVMRGGTVEALSISTARFQHDRPVIGLVGVEDMNAANTLAGTELRVPVDTLAELPAGTFYRHDLVGCQVETRGGEKLGAVSKVEGTIARSLLVVETLKGELLVPLVTEICTTIDAAGRRIVIDPPDGLLELNERR